MQAAAAASEEAFLPADLGLDRLVHALQSLQRFGRGGDGLGARIRRLLADAEDLVGELQRREHRDAIEAAELARALDLAHARIDHLDGLEQALLVALADRERVAAVENLHFDLLHRGSLRGGSGSTVRAGAQSAGGSAVAASAGGAPSGSRASAASTRARASFIRSRRRSRSDSIRPRSAWSRSSSARRRPFSSVRRCDSSSSRLRRSSSAAISWSMPDVRKGLSVGQASGRARGGQLPGASGTRSYPFRAAPIAPAGAPGDAAVMASRGGPGGVRGGPA